VLRLYYNLVPKWLRESHLRQIDTRGAFVSPHHRRDTKLTTKTDQAEKYANFFIDIRIIKYLLKRDQRAINKKMLRIKFNLSKCFSDSRGAIL